MENNFPLVSVIVPCRNEKNHIEKCIRSILNQEYQSGKIEFIVVDGMSDDGTRDILMRIEEKDSRLKVLDNPRQVTPCARNIGIREAKGQYIGIMDAHSVYSPSYIQACIEILKEHPEICCAGGPILSMGKGLFGQATAAAMSHPLGVGNAKHRFPDYEGYAEGACFPVFRKEVFDNVGLFDEDLVRNQDDEFNFRVTLSGRKIFISPRAQCRYYVREKPSQLFWQYFQYGYFKVVVLLKHRLPISLRHFAPVGFFSAMIALAVGGFFLPTGWGWTGCILPITYMGILGLGGISVALKNGIGVGMRFPLAVFIMHSSYALGFTWRLFWCVPNWLYGNCRNPHKR